MSEKIKNQSDIIELTSKKLDGKVSKSDILKVYHALFDSILEEITNGNDVRLRGYLGFKIHEKNGYYTKNIWKTSDDEDDRVYVEPKKYIKVSGLQRFKNIRIK